MHRFLNFHRCHNSRSERPLPGEPECSLNDRHGRISDVAKRTAERPERASAPLLDHTGTG